MRDIIHKELQKLTSSDVNKYINFCFNNSTEYKKGKTARHHILPKAVFPQFTNLKEFPWNGIHLSNDNHYIAHALLFEAIDNISVASAWYAMNNKNYFNNEPLILLGSSLYGQLLQKRNKQVSESSTGKVVCKDVHSNETIRVTVDEYHRRDDLVGCTKGKVSVKDKNGNRHFIDTCLYDKDIFSFHTRNRVSAKVGKMVMSVTKEEFDNSQMVGATKGMGAFKDKAGRIVHCACDDSRVLSGALVGFMRGRKRSVAENIAKQQFRKNHPEAGNASKIGVFNEDDNIVFVSFGTFEKDCISHNIPFTTFSRSYRDGKHINMEDKQFGRKCDETRYLKNIYRGWYAKKLSDEEYEKLSKTTI